MNDEQRPMAQRCGTCRYLHALRTSGGYECTWMPPIKLPVSLHRRNVWLDSGGKCPTYEAKGNTDHEEEQ